MTDKQDTQMGPQFTSTHRPSRTYAGLLLRSPFTLDNEVVCAVLRGLGIDPEALARRTASQQDDILGQATRIQHLTGAMRKAAKRRLAASWQGMRWLTHANDSAARAATLIPVPDADSNGDGGAGEPP